MKNSINVLDVQGRFKYVRAIGWPDFTNRRTDNTIANRKKTNNDHKALHGNVKIEQHEPH